MNLRQVEAFQALMETKSVTKAGKMLFVSQPAVSRLIADFENYVDLKLFERQKGRLIPTDEAKMLYKDVEKAFIGLKQLGNTIQSIKSLESGNLRIVASPGIANTILPIVISKFLKKHPDISVFIDSRPSKEVIEWASTPFYDISIASIPFDTSNLKLQFKFKADLECIMPYDHPLAQKNIISLSDFEGELFISYPLNSKIRHRIDSDFAKAGVNRHLKVDARSTQAIVNLVISKVGLSLIPPFLKVLKNEKQIILKKCSVSIPIEIAVLLSSEKPLSLVASKFLEMFKTFLNKNYDVQILS